MEVEVSFEKGRREPDILYYPICWFYILPPYFCSFLFFSFVDWDFAFPVLLCLSSFVFSVFKKIVFLLVKSFILIFNFVQFLFQFCSH